MRRRTSRWDTWRDEAKRAGLTLVLDTQGDGRRQDSWHEAVDAQGHLWGVWDGWSHEGLLTDDAALLGAFLLTTGVEA